MSAEELCLECGMCCDGSLFWAVPVEAGEPAPVELGADGYLHQPCACFTGRCTIYSERPAACRDFDCRVLQIVQSDHREMAWAHKQIVAMKRLVVQLNAMLPGSEPSVYRRAAEFYLRYPKEQHDAAFRDEHVQLLKHLLAYEKALKHFHVPRSLPGA